MEFGNDSTSVDVAVLPTATATGLFEDFRIHKICTNTDIYG